MAADSAERWKRYWRWVEHLDPGTRSPEDLFINQIVDRAGTGRWLDAGCGRRSLPPWRAGDQQALADRGARLFGCDLDRAALRDREDGAPVCAANLTHLPFRDESFALVTSNMVFEHLDDPAPAVAELARVTALGGRIIVHTVNARHYLALAARVTPLRFHRRVVGRLEGRAPEDVYPTCYRANTVAALRGLFEARGCRHVEGGAIPGVPPNVPYPGLFWLGLGLGLVERRLARLPGARAVLRPNLLMHFERT
jgi:SAM-dependent methyltransferase